MQDSSKSTGEDKGKIDLAERVWQLTELETVAMPKLPRAQVPHLEFHSQEKRVTGSTGVNRLSGPCTWGPGKIAIGMLATTRRAGPPEEMQLEHAFVVALSGVDSWEIHGRELRLCADGQISMRLRTAAPHAAAS